MNINGIVNVLSMANKERTKQNEKKSNNQQ